MVELILTEKPKASLKIATALSDGKIIKHSYKKVPYYEITYKGNKIIVACAVGHLFSLTEAKKSNQYPVEEVKWIESYRVSAGSKFTKNYVDLLKKLRKEVESFCVACDYDLEGSTIGANIMRLIFKKEDGKRMKFSTLTKSELIKSYEHANKHLDFKQVDAGYVRHELDFRYGISGSRALTNSIKNATNQYKVMSTGRVQGPTLKIIVEREKEIQSFKPVPYWQIQLLGLAKRKKIEAWHKEDKFWDKKKADNVIRNTKGKKATVKETKRTKFKQFPPNPFDLTSLQLEAYKLFKIPPSQTLKLAQSLYLMGLISYPRTSSQQLPESIDYKNILKNLSKQYEYKDLCDILLKTKLSPNNGKKHDPAHPALFATGELPEKLDEGESKIYDLIVRRTLSTFAPVAIRETMQITIEINKELFIAKGTRTIDPGWHIFYGKYAKFEEQALPDVKEGEEIKVKSISLLDKETQPPKRFTPASIIKKMESLGLGTKATRSQIVETLYNRNYIRETKIEATSLGIKTIETLEKYVPEIIDVKLTEHFEKEMQDVREGKRKKEQVLTEAKETLVRIFKRFKKNELKIGRSLSGANIKTREEQTIVGKCNKCEGKLRVMYSKKHKQYFIACNNYPKCKNTFSLTTGLPKPSNKICKECSYPTVNIIRKGKRPFEYCINKECPAKKRWIEEKLDNS